MPIVDDTSGVIRVKVVYYGPPAAGKTTNLQAVSPLIHGTESRRVTPRQVGENRIVSLEIPAESLGPVMDLRVVVRLETMQGEVANAGGGWSQALADADGIVFVADSSPHARTANFKALAGIRERLEGRGRSSVAIPIVMQWNKRDRADARPIAELETELNHGCFPSIEASSSRGTGVVETLIEILKRTIHAAHRRSGRTRPAEAELGQAVTAAIQRLSQSARAASIARYGATIERQSAAWPDVRESPRLHRDRDGVWSREAVYSVESIGEEPVATRMLTALGRATSDLDGQTLSGLPRGLMAGLLGGCDRTRGSLLLFRQGTPHLEESEIVPAGSDPLNAPQRNGGATKAATLCSGREPVFIGDPADELKAALIVPLIFGSQTFGGMVVYVTPREDSPSAAEQAYWKTAAHLTSVYLAWQAADTRAVGSRRTGRRRDLPTADTPAS